MKDRTLSHYQVIDKVGSGGMGDVYRARDTQLSREVAIKVLPPELADDPERRARFEREARSLAALQHAHIASIYGIETDGDTRFLVMELVEGEDLSVRLARGAIPLEETIDLAFQLAEGLAAAHAVGVIHRDLKPANIKLSSGGELKVLDFGLARAYANEQASDLEHSPTITAAMTQDGVILGTAAYMSPEQARGKRVDHRADIWAFGAVVFEMLTGQRLFEGETVSDTLAGVLRADVPWDDLPKKTPPALRRLLQRCLERNPSRRLQSIAEARIVLEDLKAGRGDESLPRAEARAGVVRRERLVWTVAVVALVAALASVALLRHGAPAPPVTRSTIMPPSGWDFSASSPFAVSPDGRKIAFIGSARSENDKVTAGTDGLWVRNLGESEAHLLTSASDLSYPFWSPDGKWLGFYGKGKLNKIEAGGGPVIPLADAKDGRGGTWNADGTIVFQAAWSEGLVKIPAGGGTPEPLTTPNKDHFELAHRWPRFLPDGRHFLFYIVSTTNPGTSEYSGIYVGSLDSGETKFLLKSESRGLYAEGYLLYRSGTTLMARPFDPKALTFKGDAMPIATGVPGGAISWGGANFGVSETGALVYLRGALATNSVLQWRGLDGKTLGTLGVPDAYWEPALSHDGTRLAVSLGQAATDIWILDLKRNTRTRFTFDPAADGGPQWAPDDSAITFSSSRKGAGEIYMRPTSGQGNVELLYNANASIYTSDWSDDGRVILFTRLVPGDNGWDVWMFDMKTKKASPLVAGPFNQMNGTLSPDGKWLAYESDESGQSQVYVQAFPEPNGRWMVSTTSGSDAVWRADGLGLFYLDDSESMVFVPVSTKNGFTFGAPKPLFHVSFKADEAVNYAVSRDGSRVLTNELPPLDPSKVGARLVQNWTAALRR